MQVNNLAVRTAEDLRAALDTLAEGQKVTIAFESKGKSLMIEGVVAQR